MRIVRGVGRRATAERHEHERGERGAAAPTYTAGMPAIVTAVRARGARRAWGVRMTRVAGPAAVRGDAVPAGRREGPRVVGVDARVRIAAGGLEDLVDEAGLERRAVVPGSMTDSPNGKHRTTRHEAGDPVVRIRIGRSVRRSQARTRSSSRVVAARPVVRPSRGPCGQSARRIVTTATIGTRIASCGLIRAAMTVKIAARSGRSRHSSRRPRSRKTTPNESTWPHRTRVEPADRVDDDEGGTDRGRPVAGAELPRHRPDEPGDARVGKDRRDLDQVARLPERCPTSPTRHRT